MISPQGFQLPITTTAKSVHANSANDPDDDGHVTGIDAVDGGIVDMTAVVTLVRNGATRIIYPAAHALDYANLKFFASKNDQWWKETCSTRSGIASFHHHRGDGDGERRENESLSGDRIGLPLNKEYTTTFQQRIPLITFLLSLITFLLPHPHCPIPIAPSPLPHPYCPILIEDYMNCSTLYLFGAVLDHLVIVCFVCVARPPTKIPHYRSGIADLYEAMVNDEKTKVFLEIESDWGKLFGLVEYGKDDGRQIFDPIGLRDVLRGFVRDSEENFANGAVTTVVLRTVENRRRGIVGGQKIVFTLTSMRPRENWLSEVNERLKIEGTTAQEVEKIYGIYGEKMLYPWFYVAISRSVTVRPCS